MVRSASNRSLFSFVRTGQKLSKFDYCTVSMPIFGYEVIAAAGVVTAFGGLARDDHLDGDATGLPS